jgi:anti-sigma factor RsiW
MTGMARCEDIELLLGPFEDGELEPHEMQEVARHTAICSACDGVLADFRSMGVTLRGSQPFPNLDSFASGVMARIERMHLPPPVPELGRHWYDAVSDWFANVILTGGLAAAVAIATALVMTPELSRYLHHPVANAQRSAPTVVAMAPQPPPASVKPQPVPLAGANVADKNSVIAPNADDKEASPDQVAEADNSGDAGTTISSLQSDSPSVAVWTAPDNKTTVVWVPDQQP